MKCWPTGKSLIKLMASWNTAVSPSLMHWRYHNLAQSHGSIMQIRYINLHNVQQRETCKTETHNFFLFFKTRYGTLLGLTGPTCWVSPSTLPSVWLQRWSRYHDLTTVSRPDAERELPSSGTKRQIVNSFMQRIFSGNVNKYFKSWLSIETAQAFEIHCQGIQEHSQCHIYRCLGDKEPWHQQPWHWHGISYCLHGWKG